MPRSGKTFVRRRRSVRRIRTRGVRARVSRRIRSKRRGGMTALELEQIADQIVAAYDDKELDKPLTLPAAFNYLTVPNENWYKIKMKIKQKLFNN